MKGFYNLGNTCYLNSGLQMLINIPELCNLILNHKEKTNELKYIAEFIIKYHSSDNGVMKPNKIKKIISNKNSIFSGFNQEDSQEFVIYFLDFIDEQLKNSLNDFMGIKINNLIKCKEINCLTVSKTSETKLFLMLEIKPNFETLNDCYRDYKNREKLQGDDRYYCEKCKKKRIASKRIEVTNWPTNLIIVLKRFYFNGREYEKNNQFIDIPLLWRHNYKLVGGVIHSGRLGGGHYVYFGKKKNKWYLFDDSHINPIKSNLDSYKNRAYLLHFLQ